MTATDTIVARTAVIPQTISMFSGKALGWLTFWLSAPVGLVLMAHNCWELGQRNKMVAYFGAAALAVVAITAMWTIPSPFGTLAIIATNIATLLFLRKQAETYEVRTFTAGNSVSYRNGWIAILVALPLAVALGMVSNTLLAIFFA